MRENRMSMSGVAGFIITLAMCQAANAAPITSQVINSITPNAGQVVTVTSTAAYTNTSGGFQMAVLQNSYRVVGAPAWTVMAGSQGSSMMNGQGCNLKAVGMFTCPGPAGVQIEIRTQLINPMNPAAAPIDTQTTTITVGP